MSSQNLRKELQAYIEKHGKSPHVTTNLQLAKPNSIVFYKLDESKKSQDLFWERFNKTSNKKIALLISNVRPSGYEGAFCLVSPSEFLNAQKVIADKIYGKPSQKIIGVTGTNGKTTVVDMIRQIAVLNKLKVASLGTLGLLDANGSVIEDLGATSPSYLDLRRLLAENEDVFDFLVCEISSHALEQDRLFDLELDTAGWTSFSQDHLDYHKTMEQYFISKLKIVNKVCESGKLFLPQREEKLVDKVKAASSFPVNIAPILDEKLYDSSSPFFQCHYNQANFELALAISNYVFKLDCSASEVLQRIKPPAGRFDTVNVNGGFAIIDYAHTPDAIQNICLSIQKTWPDKKLLTIVGCGGNRDKTKRPVMAKVAFENSNGVIFTSDNPRDEKPQEIIDEMLLGVSNWSKLSNVHIEVEREKAINLGLKLLKSGEFNILLIAGKGHENYQEIKGQKIDFSDKEIVLRAKDES